MKIRAWFTFLFFFHSFVFGQKNEIDGFVFSDNNMPVPYAVLANTRKNIGTYSNENGAFTLEYKTEDDSFRVTAIGYYDTIVSIKSILQSNKIILRQNEILLKETKVTPVDFSKSKKYEIGYHRYKHNGHIMSLPGYKVAILLKPEIQNSYIETINFQLRKIGDCHFPLSIRLHENDGGKPGKDLINDNIIVQPKEIKRRMKVNVSKYQVRMPDEGLFVSIDWIDIGCKNKVISKVSKNPSVSPVLVINLKLNESIQWNAYRNKDWYKIPTREDNLNPNIGLTLKVPKGR